MIYIVTHFNICSISYLHEIMIITSKSNTGIQKTARMDSGIQCSWITSRPDYNWWTINDNCHIPAVYTFVILQLYS